MSMPGSRSLEVGRTIGFTLARVSNVCLMESTQRDVMYHVSSPNDEHVVWWIVSDREPE
jgi:hypothetical protein